MTLCVSTGVSSPTHTFSNSSYSTVAQISEYITIVFSTLKPTSHLLYWSNSLQLLEYPLSRPNDLLNMLNHNHFIGSIGEWISLAYLQLKGHKLITKNYRCRYGEIDLIMTDNDDYVFIEVKSRASITFHNPLFSISTLKQQRIIKTSEHFLEKLGHYQNLNVRYDVALVCLYPCSIDWIPNAFTSQHPF